jgi:hypothetical protein
MAGEKHKGYTTVKKLIDGHQLIDFMDIFNHVPPTAVFKDLGINHERSKRLMKDVKGYRLEELYYIAGRIGVDEKIILDFAHAQHIAAKGKKKGGKL